MTFYTRPPRPLPSLSRFCHREKEQTIIHSRFFQKIIYVFTFSISIFYIFNSINHSFSEVLRKGVPRQNFHSPKKCCEKGEVLRKGGVAKRGTTGVFNIRWAIGLFYDRVCKHWIRFQKEIWVLNNIIFMHIHTHDEIIEIL